MERDVSTYKLPQDQIKVLSHQIPRLVNYPDPEGLQEAYTTLNSIIKRIREYSLPDLKKLIQTYKKIKEFEEAKKFHEEALKYLQNASSYLKRARSVREKNKLESIKYLEEVQSRIKKAEELLEKGLYTKVEGYEALQEKLGSDRGKILILIVAISLIGIGSMMFFQTSVTTKAITLPIGSPLHQVLGICLFILLFILFLYKRKH